MKVYEYGCLAPTLNRDRVLDQMRLANKYQNQLIELDRWRRQKALEILGSDTQVAVLDARVSDLEARLEAARAQVKEQSVKDRKKTDRKSITAPIIAALKEVRAQRKEARTQARPQLQKQFDDLHQEVLDRTAELRSKSEVYWGTYLLAERAVQAAAISPTPPKFKAWRGEGGVSVQIQKGIDTTAIFSGEDTRVSIAPVPEHTFEKLNGYFVTRKCDRKRLSRTVVRIRIGSNPDKSPIWASFPMILHRPLPKDAKILWVRVQRRLIADHEKWTCQVTFDSEETAPILATEGTAAINLGWRKREGEAIRVGYVVDGDGKEQEILVPERVSQRIKKCEDLRSIRDKMFDRAKSLLSSSLDQMRKSDGVPEWMAKQTSHLHLWRSPRKMVILVKTWLKETGKSGRVKDILDPNWASSSSAASSRDSATLLWLTYWYHRDRHLWQWECHNRVKAYGHRREVFRVFAANLAKQYKTIAVGEVDLRDFATKEKPEEASEHGSDSLRYQRALAAPSILRGVLKNAANHWGARYLEPKAPYTPKCTKCGTDNLVDEKLRYICTGCKSEWDQDSNASINIWRAAQSMEPPPRPLAADKTAKLKKLMEGKARRKAAKAAKSETARD